MGRRRAANDPSVRVELSERQHQVLELIAKGATNGEIAERLGISLDGVKWHVREILARLDVESREKAAAWWHSRRRWSLLPAWMPRFSWPVVVSTAAAGGIAGVAVLLAVNHGSDSSDGGEAVATQATATAAPTRTPVVSLIPEVAQPPLREVDAGNGWRLLVADDGLPVPSADRAVVAVRWDLETPYLDILDVDGRRAMRVEVGYRPMARLDPNANRLVISDWANIESDDRRSRVLIFDLAGPAYLAEVPFADRRVNGTVFTNPIRLSNDGRWLYWVEHSVQSDPPSCATGGDEAVCDRMVVHAVDLVSLAPSSLRADMPRACAVPALTPHGPSGVLAQCSRGAGDFVLDAALSGNASNAVTEAPEGTRQDSWDMRGAEGSTIALRLSIASDGEVVSLSGVERATGEFRFRHDLTDVWEVHLLDDRTALILRPTGRLERMDLVTGDSKQLPYAIEPGDQGLDIALVR